MSEHEDKTRQRAIEVSERLLGTCASLHDILDDDERGIENDLTFCAVLDDQVAECSACGWWCEPGELNDDSECADCADEEDDD